MHKRIRLQKIIIFILGAVVSLMIISFLFGRSNTVSVLVVGSDKIDPTKLLSDQSNLIIKKNVSKADYDLFNGKLVTSWRQLKDAKLKYPMTAGSPLLVDSLTTTKSAGQFASEMPEYHTIFKLTDAVAALPPGVQAGDRIDINIILNNKASQANPSGGLMTGPLLKDVKIFAIDATVVYLEVTQKEFSELSLAKEIGTFVYQLPGRKKVGTCDVVINKLKEEQQKEIDGLTADASLSDVQRASKTNDINAKYESRIQNAECYTDDSKLTTVSSKEIIDKILANGQTVPADNGPQGSLTPVNSNGGSVPAASASPQTNGASATGSAAVGGQTAAGK